MNPNHYTEKGCFTKHPLKNCCLGYQAEIIVQNVGFTLHPAFDVPEVFRHLGQDHSGSDGWADGGVDVELTKIRSSRNYQVES